MKLKKVLVGCGVAVAACAVLLLIIGIVGAWSDYRYSQSPEAKQRQAESDQRWAEVQAKARLGEDGVARVLSAHHGAVTCKYDLRERHEEYPHRLRFCTTVTFQTWVRRPEDLQVKLDDVRFLLAEPEGMVLYEGGFPTDSQCVRAVFNAGQMVFELDTREIWNCKDKYRAQVDVDACKREAWRKVTR